MQSAVAPLAAASGGIWVLQSVHAPTPQLVGVSATQAVAPPGGRQVPAAQRQLLPTGSKPALHLKSQVWVATLQVGVAFATAVVQVVHVGPQAVVLSATQARPNPGGGTVAPHATVPAAHTHLVPVVSGSYPALQVTPQLCVSGLQAAAPFPLVGPGQMVQFGPQAFAVSAAHVPGWPQVFVPAAQTQPPAPSETNPFAASQVKPQAPVVQVAMAPAGTGHLVQLAPQRSGLSALQVVSAPQTFVFAGQTQPRPWRRNVGSHWKSHAPELQTALA